VQIIVNKVANMMNRAQSIKTLSRISAFAAAGMLAFAFAPVHAVGATKLTDVKDTVGVTTSLTGSHSVTFGYQGPAAKSIGAWKVNEGSNDAHSASSFWVYCLDPLNAFKTPDTYDKTSLENFVKGTGPNTTNNYTTMFAAGAAVKDQYGNVIKAATGYQARNVVGSYDDSTTNTSRVLADLTELYSHAYADSLLSKTKSAAFQFAIWELEGDGKGKSFDGGKTYDGKYYIDSYANSGLDINGTSAFSAQATAYLDALNNNAWSNVMGANLTAKTNYTFNVYNPNPTGGQVLLSVTPNGSQVPEPGSLALAGLALFGVVYTRRQGKSKAH
jgi:hypothetical protein